MGHRFKNTPRFLSCPKPKLAIMKTLTLRSLTKKSFKKKKIKLTKEIITKLNKFFYFLVIMKIN